MLWVSPFSIGHFRVAVSFILKARLSVKPFIWKLVLFHINGLIFITRFKATRKSPILWVDMAMLCNIMQIIIEWFHRFAIFVKKNERIYHRLSTDVGGN